ncbi:transketolase C-terminal domain-containing protein [Sphaerobacter sp.]|uniref:transketolase family protein n=1 Tax=Sphaerobacter sp. TaxID=2099654 RepID=UPI001DB458FD|nr:transketolase C-terminal domain-containing protein [Sphaerobacter sp.]MBX5445407.1 transketolase family protein [Sphaerobacter sp.]
MNLGTEVGLKMGKATRDAFGEALRDIGRENPAVVVVDGDVSNSTRTEWFGKEFPDRFFDVGIAESNLVGVASGLAANGKIPVAASFAAFLLCNAYDQIRMGVAYPHLNVKLVGSHAGISIGEDGPSQMAIEDVALACALPGVVVLVPADEHAARAATRAMIAYDGPTYLRVGRPNVPVVYDENVQIEIGKAITVREGGDVTIIANGLMVAAALDAAARLAGQGIEARVLDMHTVKPLDEAAVAAAARETGGIVVAEEHLHHGGLGSVVAMAVARLHPCRMGFVDLDDTYAQSGTGEELLREYGLTADRIVEEATRIVRGG